MPPDTSQTGRRTDRGRRFALLRERRFRTFFTTYSVSLFGTSMASVALSFGILDEGLPIDDLGYVNAARIVPMVVFLVGGGVLGDRLPRQLVMLTSDCARVLSQGAIALLFVLGHAPLWALMSLAAIGGIGEALFNPALSGMIPSITPSNQVQDANSLLGLARSTANILGPTLAGLLVALAGPQTVLWLDSASYAVSVVGLLLLRLPATVLPATTSLIGQLREGWTAFRSRTWLWAITLQFSFFNLIVWGPYLILGPISAHQAYGGATSWGLMVGGYGAGSVLGGLLLLGRRPARPLTVAIAATFLWACPSAALLVRVPLGLVLAGTVCAGIASAVFNSLWSATIQQHTEPTLQSRVSAYVSLGAYLFGPAGLAIVGPVAEHVGIRTVLAVGVGWQLLSSAVVLALPAVRAVRQPSAESPQDLTASVA